ncbi:MAG: lycopene cyclase family protein [Mycobacteriaceae bacterium]
MSDKGPPSNPFHAQAVGILGLGPAGRAVASACASAGLAVTAVDPHPWAPWRATYGGWVDELPDAVPRAATVTRPTAWTSQRQEIPRMYSVLDNAALQQSLDLSGVRVVTGTANGTVDGDLAGARLIIDARGASASGRTQQTAYGVVVDRARAECVLDGDAALFMDWRTDHGAGPDEAPSFLYAVPVGGDRMLLEETSLARRPGLGYDVLAQRLKTRLAGRGLQLGGDERMERVRFALDTPLPAREWAGRAPSVVRFGAAAPLVHPASGYSVAATLRLAPRIAAIIASGGTAADVQDLIWSPRALAVHALRLRGLRAVCALSPAEVPHFFAAFFALPVALQRSYLSGRDDLAGTAAAMWGLFPRLASPTRGRLVRAAVLG